MATFIATCDLTVIKYQKYRPATTITTNNVLIVTSSKEYDIFAITISKIHNLGVKNCQKNPRAGRRFDY